MYEINDPIKNIHHITLSVGSAQEDYDFHTKVLSLKSVKKTLIYDGKTPFYHLYYGNDLGEEGTLITCFPVAHFGHKGRRGAGQISGLSLSVPVSAMSFWAKRLADHGFSIKQNERFGEPVIEFAHPCGIEYELIGVADDKRKAYGGGEVPAEYAIRGMHTISVKVREMELSQEFMTDAWPAKETGKDGKFTRFGFGNGGSGKFVDYVLEPDLPMGDWRYGSGTVHHCAFQVEDAFVQKNVKRNLEGLGYTDTSEPKDRGYFDSIYVRAPSGALFEAAVSKEKGFLVDEPYETLGKEVMVAPQFRSQREQILQSLEQLKF